MTAERVERAFACGPEPHVVVEITWRIRVGRSPEAGHHVALHPSLDVMHRPDLSAMHGFDGLLIVGTGSLLAACLHHPVMPSGRLEHLATLSNCQRKRLLDIDIQSRATRHDRLDRVPVVGSGDHDRVHRAVFQQFPKVSVGLGFALGIAKRLFQMRLVDVACGDRLGIPLRKRFLPDLTTAVPGADDP